LLFGPSGRRFHDVYRVLTIYWIRISIWEIDIDVIHYFVVSCLGKGLPTTDSFFKEYWQIFTRRFRSTGYGVQWSALSFCGNIIKFLRKLTLLLDVSSYILSGKCPYLGGTFCLMCSTEDEGSRLTCTFGHFLASNLMGTALRTPSLVYVIYVKRPLTLNF
jgi:hypothetical protein